MADLTDLYSDPTLDAMMRAVAAQKANEPRRNYLGASQLGEPCERKVWYGFNNYPRTPIDAKGAMAIEDGHRTEDLIIERLRLVPGVHVQNRLPDGQQLGFSDLGGLLRGHIDGLITGLLQARQAAHVLEIKCINDKKFDNLRRLVHYRGEKRALQEWDVVYYAQAQLYMLKFGTSRHYLVAATPGGRNVTSCRTDLDADYARSLIVKAQRVISAQQPPMRAYDNPDFFKCRFCDFSRVCWS